MLSWDHLQNLVVATSLILLSSERILLSITFKMRSLNLWRESSLEINSQIYMGNEKGNAEGKSNEILGAYDFLYSNGTNFNVNVWYNASYKDAPALRLPRAVNLVTNAYLQLFIGLGAEVTLGFIKEMPKTSNALIKFDIDRFSNGHPLLYMGYFTTIPWREHLLFYGRLKNLKGSALKRGGIIILALSLSKIIYFL